MRQRTNHLSKQVENVGSVFRHPLFQLLFIGVVKTWRYLTDDTVWAFMTITLNCRSRIIGISIWHIDNFLRAFYYITLNILLYIDFSEENRRRRIDVVTARKLIYNYTRRLIDALLSLIRNWRMQDDLFSFISIGQDQMMWSKLTDWERGDLLLTNSKTVTLASIIELHWPQIRRWKNKEACKKLHSRPSRIYEK